MKRREFLHTLAASTAVTSYLSIAHAVENFEEVLAASRKKSHQAHEDLSDMEQLKMHGNEKIYMLLYPGLTALDLVGPQYMFAAMMGATIHLVAKDSTQPVETDTGFSIMPTLSFAEVSDTPTVFFIPGSAGGIIKAMKDSETIEFVEANSKNATYVTSVCTGSLLLGRAGLLKDKRATTHWTAMDCLQDFGAIPVNERVVTDGNLITGGGVTAGIDFGLTILAKLRGANYARTVQLSAEYSPAPPFNSGTPESAPSEITKHMRDMYDPLIVQIKEIAKSS